MAQNEAPSIAEKPLDLWWGPHGAREGWWLGRYPPHDTRRPGPNTDKFFMVHGPSICVYSGGGPAEALRRARRDYPNVPICIQVPPKHTAWPGTAECHACAELVAALNQLAENDMSLDPNQTVDLEYLHRAPTGIRNATADMRNNLQMKAAALEIERLQRALAERDQNPTEAPLIPVYEFPVVGQTWQHYKGDRYTIIGLGPDAVTGVPTVSYRATKQKSGHETPLHPRSLDSFLQSIDLPPEGQYAWQNKTGPRHAQRFVRIRDGVEA